VDRVASTTLPRALAIATIGLAWCGSAHAAAPLILQPDHTINGDTYDDELGSAIAAGGDLNGDGLDDLVLGVPKSDPTWPNAGEVYILFGRTSGWTAITDIGAADATIRGEDEDDWLGYSVAVVGDVDDDGLDDLLIGAPYRDSFGISNGESYLILGRTAGWATGLDAATIADVSINGTSMGDLAGFGLAGIGDVNDDGVVDFAIGAPFNGEAASDAGQVYVFFGTATGWPLTMGVADADATLLGENSGDELGVSIAGVGDVNGDHIDDLLLGAPTNDDVATASGKAYLRLGSGYGWGTDVPAAVADASFLGGGADHELGRSVAGAGDIDGDGLRDLLIGAWEADDTGTDAGAVYLVFGSTTGWQPDTPAADADVTLFGTSAYDYAGQWLHGGGDFDGDGLDDIVVSAPRNDDAGNDTGQAYLVLGRASGWSPSLMLDEATASLMGAEPDDEIQAAILAGDLNGDGLDDLVAGSPYADAPFGEEGVLYLVHGFSCDDTDGDGYAPCGVAPGLLDCDDADGATYPGAPEVCDGVDNDCDSEVDEDSADVDADGFPACWGDCNDYNPSIFPGADEGCDGEDTDCDGAVGADEVDEDGDGYLLCAGDCDDTLDFVHPGAPDTCGDGIDSDCGDDLDWETDNDADGYAPCEDDCHDNDPSLGPWDDDLDGYSPCTGDCDDAAASTFPGAEELCNGVDDNCDGWPGADENDDDADGYMRCEGDCADYVDWVNPGQTEVPCNGVDDDCDAETTDQPDVDLDGFSACYGDCDDEDGGTFPGAAEACDGRDNNCNGQTDEGFDHDADGFSSCSGGDCDDDDFSIYPGGPEIPYDGIDQDCDGSDLTDIDGDGHAGGARGVDCDDLRAWVFPGAPEDCTDGVDADCDGIEDAAETDCVGAGCHIGGSGSGTAAALVALAAMAARLRR